MSKCGSTEAFGRNGDPLDDVLPLVATPGKLVMATTELPQEQEMLAMLIGKRRRTALYLFATCQAKRNGCGMVSSGAAEPSVDLLGNKSFRDQIRVGEETDQ